METNFVDAVKSKQQRALELQQLEKEQHELMVKYAEDQFRFANMMAAKAQQTLQWCIGLGMKINQTLQKPFFTFTEKNTEFQEKQSNGELPKYDMACVAIATENMTPGDLRYVINEGIKALQKKNDSKRIISFCPVHFAYKAGVSPSSITNNGEVIAIVEKICMHAKSESSIHKNVIQKLHPKETDNGQWTSNPVRNNFTEMIDKEVATFWERRSL